MSRRKQARPIKHLEEEGATARTDSIKTSTTAAAAAARSTHGDSPASCSEEDVSCGVPVDASIVTEPLTCTRCQEQFTNVPEFLSHKAVCERQAFQHLNLTPSDSEDMVISEYDEEEDEETGGKRLEKDRRHRQDAANNNSVDEEEGEREIDGLPVEFPFPLPSSTSHVTLEALQNTKVAVAQFAATAMANNADNEAALQELAVLQSTLFTLQHQQVFQLQLINQLQQQLTINRVNKDGSPTSPLTDQPNEQSTNEESPERPSTPSEPREPTPPPPPPPPSTSVPPPPPQEPTDTPITEPSTLPLSIQPNMCSISSSLAASIITNNDPPPSLDEPNTLEMLQKRAQEVLDNASQGLLANNLADELAFRKSKGSLSPYDSKSGRNEPFFKHRCRYCGKVFGSDSALQIHIRSHTGERPFKCNVCGSRFTTKGNLKVHFQRHTTKFPHIKMNPNPVPEHLDKYHPPLLAQMGQSGGMSPGPPAHHPAHAFSPGNPFPPTSMPVYRPPMPPTDLITPRLPTSLQRPEGPNPRILPSYPLFVRREEQDVPENLTKPPSSPSPETHMKTEPMDDREIEEPKEPQPPITPKQELDMYNEELEQENMQSPGLYDDCSMDSKYSNEELLRVRSPLMEHGDNMQDEPENLSNKSNSVTMPLSISTGQRLPASFNFPHASSPPSSTSSGSMGSFSIPCGTDPAKDPALYTSLLPRPGSNDNSWESLIEVTKTSETSKLQQLVDNIEHKLTDPNQCVICHRVLSCKSALQMHYRTHTGERPFKCKICGRAFTTKGNLKTHMGVHRAKPPMRVLHQCPVCHKKFTNALVLQQHIRLHTGEPTDLTPEQIQAAEIKEFSSPTFPGMPNSVSPFLTQHIQIPGLSPLTATNLSLNMKSNDMDMKEDQEEEEDMDKYDMSNEKLPSFSTSLAALENQVKTITTMASQLTASNRQEEMLCSSRIMTSTPTPQNGEKSPTRSEVESPTGSDIRSSPNQMPVQIPRPPSSQPMNSPTPSESNSLGALDLTPRSTQPLSHSPGPSPGPQPIFSNFPGLMPPGPGSSPLISSALSSLTSSVLNSTAYSPLGLGVGPALRGNTTCNICFKTFACNSALEIHYRSHTKERPFKCTVCDRGFSTKNGPGCTCGQRRIQDGGSQKRKKVGKKKSPPPSPKILSSKLLPLVLVPGYATASEWSPLLGNMKQHMLTHKIRDMPHHIFDKPPNMTPQPPEEALPASIPREIPMPPHPAAVEPTLPPPPPELTLKPDISVKRSTSESELPIPKRNPNMQSSKHLCHVCNKNFSSSSALQIHMRTHTGDKPFRCNVCQKAFTTKGNLKVHMGTHMWSNGASRRGRRMSLDLPPIPMTPKDSEFLQRRPDLFYPYLPAPFLNGMQQKLNEISVIQNANNSTGKYTGLLGFGYPPPGDAHRSQSGSPLSEKPSTRPPSHEAVECGRELPRMWDLHYERKPAAEQSLDMSATAPNNPPPLSLPPPPRGEGLAA